MRIADVMNRDLPTVAPGDNLCHAARQMANKGVRALPVCDGERLTGIITDWDVTRAVAADRDAADHMLGEYMSTEVVTVAPETQLTEASEVMSDCRVHHLVVRDGERYAGMVHLDVDWSQMGGLETPIATFSARI
jgi:CBS domain-containing protein